MLSRGKTGVAAAIGAACVALAVAPPAHAAYQESHQTADDVRITVDSAGKARVEHTIRYRVVGGTLQKIDLRGIDLGGVVDPASTIIADDGKELTAHAEADGERNVRVSVDEPKGLKRGLYTFRVRYTVDLVAARALVRDGAMWRFSWISTTAPEGYDGARVVLAFPAAQTEPRAVKTGPLNGVASRDGEGGEDGVLSTLRRTPGADELELVRPHVARGEAPRWAARLDPKALPDVQTAELRPMPMAPPPQPNRAREVGTAVALLAMALAFGALVRAKAASFAALAGTSAGPPSLVRLGKNARAVLGGAAFAGGVGVQAAGFPTVGAALVGVAMLTAVSCVVREVYRPRGPGRWLALRPAEAFLPQEQAPEGQHLDIGTRAGKWTAFGIFLVLAPLAFLAQKLSPAAPYLLALDALALGPIFLTGRASQLPPDPARAPVKLLRGLYRRLESDKTLKLAPWARIPIGGENPDELRLLIVPRGPLPGLIGIEVGVAWGRTATGYVGTLEVLVRVHDATSAAAKMAKLAPQFRAIPGRKQEERVIRLAPRLPGIHGAKNLVQRLARELADRRIVDPAPWKATDRRLPPNAKTETRPAPRAAA